MAIPRIIHQTLPGKNDMNDAIRANISRLRELNSEWEHRLYYDRDIYEFIAGTFDSDVLRSYQSINPRYGAAKADFFRYLLLYQIGGVYLDIKSTVTKPLDSVLRPDDQFLLSHWANDPGEPYQGWGKELPGLGPRGEYQQWHIVAAPQHLFLEAVIRRVQYNIRNYHPTKDGVGRLAVVRTTGPYAYTLAIADVLHQAQFRLVDIRELGFEYSILSSPRSHQYHPKHYSLVDRPLILFGGWSRLRERTLTATEFARGKARRITAKIAKLPAVIKHR